MPVQAISMQCHDCQCLVLVHAVMRLSWLCLVASDDEALFIQELETLNIAPYFLLIRKQGEGGEEEGINYT
jgi:hypothetical protein